MASAAAIASVSMMRITLVLLVQVSVWCCRHWRLALHQLYRLAFFLSVRASHVVWLSSMFFFLFTFNRYEPHHRAMPYYHHHHWQWPISRLIRSVLSVFFSLSLFSWLTLKLSSLPHFWHLQYFFISLPIFFGLIGGYFIFVSTRERRTLVDAVQKKFWWSQQTKKAHTNWCAVILDWPSSHLFTS